jgi:hypothetical protein
MYSPLVVIFELVETYGTVWSVVAAKEVFPVYDQLDVRAVRRG